jgi:uncharacterized protein DUF6265
MRIGFLVLCLLAVPVFGRAQQARIQDVAWMQGCWEMVTPERMVEEHWMAPRGGSMLGLGRTTRGAKLVEHEFIVLSEKGDRLAYEAHPSGQAPAVFLSKTIGESSVIFENLQHDFPQRIGYQKRGPDGFLAWIEGPRNGQVRRIEFPYRRAACTAIK